MVQGDEPIRGPAKVAPSGIPGVSSLLSLAVAVVVVAALYFAREVLIPITVAVILSFILAPLVSRLKRWHVPKVAAVLFAMLVGLGVVGVLGAVIGTQVAGIAQDVPQYTATISRKVHAVRDMTVGRLRGLKQRLDEQVGRTAQEATADQSGVPADVTPKAELVRIQSAPMSAVDLARTVLAPVVDPLSTLLIILIVTIFVLMQREDLRDRMIRLFGSNDLQRTTVALDDAGHRLATYYVAQLAINTCFGVVVGLGLWLIGIPSPVLWGVTSAVLRFVPYIGPAIAALLPAALAAAVDSGWSMVLWTLSLFAVTETVTGQAVEPLVYGHSTGLSPAAVVIAAIFWTWVWGPIGLLLSTPLTLCLVVLGRHVDQLEFLDVILGDRPPLTPVENFYQRMLAEDPDEALHQAELLLEQCSLTRYYDEVAMIGLQLAANDALRGALGPEKVDVIKENVKDLIGDLAHYEDRDPNSDDREEADAVTSKAERDLPKPAAPQDDAPGVAELTPHWRASEPVLCIAGRGPLDEAAGAMLAQLLGKHGLGARVSPYGAASRREIERLDVDGVAMVCVSYLGVSGNSSGLHYLVRRLRARMPNAKILVGLGLVDEDAVKEDRTRRVVAADVYASSLGDAVEACVRAAHADAAPGLCSAPGDDGPVRHKPPSVPRGKPLTLVP